MKKTVYSKPVSQLDEFKIVDIMTVSQSTTGTEELIGNDD